MNTIQETAPAFVEMAHRIVWCSAATVDSAGRPRSRILHPIWQWDGATLTGWIATSPTPTKRSHLAAHPYISLNYWTPSQDTCVAECRVSWALDDATRAMVWELFASAPPPVGYNPAIIPAWTSPSAPAFVVLHLQPWRLRVLPASVFTRQSGQIFTWQE